MPRLRFCLIFAIALCTLSTSISQIREPLVLYVSTHGSDAGNGDRTHPLATLEGARVRARELRDRQFGIPLKVFLAPGSYALSRSFILQKEDGGDSLSPVTYCAEKNGSVRLTGGKTITGFRQLTDPSILSRMDPVCQGRILECDLASNGIADAGTMRPRGFERPIGPSPLELFIDGTPMTLARYPDSGWVFIADTLAGSRDSAFVYSDDRPSRWHGEQNIWLHGYWTWDWADTYVRVASIDTVHKLITTSAPHGYKGYTPKKRYAALNILAELDTPGEYYVDRNRNMLYFWPPDHAKMKSVTVSLLETPLLVLDNTAWVTFAGFTLECTRGLGIEIVDGHHNTIAGCTLRNIGAVGVSVGRFEPMLGSRIYDSTLYNGRAGHDNGVQSCTISQCGEGGVILCGGDRVTLEPGRNFVDNCHIIDCCRWSKTYRAGVFMWGVGNRLSHSVIHDLPHTAAFFWGNDHTLEYNEIYDVCQETGDAGAFYQGRDWSQRGNVIRYNYFHDVRGVQGQEGFIDVMSVYMDDFASGTTVSGNIFVRGGRAVMIGGGRDVLVENNLFIDCNPAVHVDARGLRDWAAAAFDGPNSVLMKRLRAVRFEEPPYSARYPRLPNILKENYVMPERNTIRRNISFGGVWRDLQDGITDSLVIFQDNFVDRDPGFVSAEKGDFRLRAGASVFEYGFKPLPVKEIGLYRDTYRMNISAERRGIPGAVAPER